MWRSSKLLFLYSVTIASYLGSPALAQEAPTQSPAIPQVQPLAPPITETPVSALPVGLFSADPEERVRAIQQIEKDKTLGAEDKLASMLTNDPNNKVRGAACQALASLRAVSQIELLKAVAANDADASVRIAAGAAVRLLTGGQAQRNTLETQVDSNVADSEIEPELQDEKYKSPEIGTNDAEPITRHLALGVGTMGGYGLASLNLRIRIPTKAERLPSIGIELGGGWTPPGFYQVISGMLGEVNDKDNKWRIISGGGAVLIYLHRLHYIPIRGGFDIGQGPYGLLGYGFEQLNQEGFFSWGVEVGILYHPAATKWADNVTDCENHTSCSEDELWPVIPFVRFSLHFYLV